MKDAIGEAARKPYRFGWREGLPDFVCRTSCELSACPSVLEGLPDLLRRKYMYIQVSGQLVWFVFRLFPLKR